MLLSAVLLDVAVCVDLTDSMGVDIQKKNMQVALARALGESFGAEIVGGEYVPRGSGTGSYARDVRTAIVGYRDHHPHDFVDNLSPLAAGRAVADRVGASLPDSVKKSWIMDPGYWKRAVNAIPDPADSNNIAGQAASVAKGTLMNIRSELRATSASTFADVCEIHHFTSSL